MILNCGKQHDCWAELQDGVEWPDASLAHVVVTANVGIEQTERWLTICAETNGSEPILPARSISGGRREDREADGK